MEFLVQTLSIIPTKTFIDIIIKILSNKLVRYEKYEHKFSTSETRPTLVRVEHFTMFLARTMCISSVSNSCNRCMVYLDKYLL